MGRWGHARRNSEELWEFDFSYWGEDDNAVMRVLDRYKDSTHRDRDWWESIPEGVVSHIDRHDLPREKHIARARELVSLGASFVVLLDLDARDIVVVRLEGLEPEGPVRGFDSTGPP